MNRSWLLPIRCPFSCKNLPRDLETRRLASPNRVQLGSPRPVREDSPRSALADAAVLVDLSHMNIPGERTFTSRDASINLPTGVDLLRAVPSQLRLRFERLLAGTVPCRSALSRNRAPATSSPSSRSHPDHLRIQRSGKPRSADRSAQTDPIDFSSAVGRAEFRVHAYVSDPQVRFEGSPMVTVTVEVEKIP